MPEWPHVHSNLGYVGLNIDIFGVSELKWTGMGELNSDDHYIYNFWQESLGRNRVALIVSKRVGKAVVGNNLKSNRIISVSIQGKPFNITKIQVYDPTTDSKEDVIDWFYEYLKHFLKLPPKEDVFFIIEDWNAKVGSQKIDRITDKLGLGEQNEAGLRLIEFCQENTLVIANVGTSRETFGQTQGDNGRQGCFIGVAN